MVATRLGLLSVKHSSLPLGDVFQLDLRPFRCHTRVGLVLLFMRYGAKFLNSIMFVPIFANADNPKLKLQATRQQAC